MDPDPQDSLVTSSEDVLLSEKASTSAMALPQYLKKKNRKKKSKELNEKFPWLRSFLKLCHTSLGVNSIKVLLNLITDCMVGVPIISIETCPASYCNMRPSIVVKQNDAAKEQALSRICERERSGIARGETVSQGPQPDSAGSERQVSPTATKLWATLAYNIYSKNTIHNTKYTLIMTTSHDTDKLMLAGYCAEVWSANLVTASLLLCWSTHKTLPSRVQAFRSMPGDCCLVNLHQARSQVFSDGNTGAFEVLLGREYSLTLTIAGEPHND
ncbi:hypothetical protein J6590_046912 [Homalodisca vitripennis]|nr:hypothetical protein J6590_046912 [Homalodisca vitripennis]